MPPPAEQLARIQPGWYVLAPRTELWRIYTRGGPFPTTWKSFRAFGPTDLRFDHQLPPPGIQGRKVYYAAESIVTCFAEVFQDTGFIDPAADERWLVGFRLARPVRLLNLRGLWPTRAGASMALNTGDRSIARQWSQMIDEAYPQADGLYYASAMNAHEPTLALYERAEAALGQVPIFHRALADLTLRLVLEQAASVLNYRLGL